MTLEDDIRARKNRWKIENPERARGHQTKANIKKHGLTPEQFTERLSGQGGVCAICGADKNANGRRLSVDHDHSCCAGDTSCGKCVRGILCHRCNVGLGQFQTVENLAEAIVYLLDWENNQLEGVCST